MDHLIELTKKYSRIDGISGQEKEIRDAIAGDIAEYCDIKIDNRGNLLCWKKGQMAAKQRIMLTAHMDEAGFMVTGIRDDGLLTFSNAGEIDPRTVVGKPVRVGSCSVPGVIGTKPIHLQTAEEQAKPMKTEDLCIDVGASNREEAEKRIKLGDGVVFDSVPVQLANGSLSGKACGIRSGCAVLASLLSQEWKFDGLAAFTVNTETGISGAANAAFQMSPDVALIIGIAPANDGIGGKGSCALGKGPVITLRDANTLYDLSLYQLCLDTAKELGVPIQTVRETSNLKNESRSVQTSTVGVKVLALSIPCRYPRSISSMVHPEDLESLKTLLSGLTERLI